MTSWQCQVPSTIATEGGIRRDATAVLLHYKPYAFSAPVCHHCSRSSLIIIYKPGSLHIIFFATLYLCLFSSQYTLRLWFLAHYRCCVWLTHAKTLSLSSLVVLAWESFALLPIFPLQENIPPIPNATLLTLLYKWNFSGCKVIPFWEHTCKSSKPCQKTCSMPSSKSSISSMHFNFLGSPCIVSSNLHVYGSGAIICLMGVCKYGCHPKGGMNVVNLLLSSKWTWWKPHHGSATVL